MAQVRDAYRGSQIGEDQVTVVLGRGGAIGRQVGRAVWANGGHEPQALLPNHSFHVLGQYPHFLFSRPLDLIRIPSGRGIGRQFNPGRYIGDNMP